MKEKQSYSKAFRGMALGSGIGMLVGIVMNIIFFASDSGCEPTDGSCNDVGGMVAVGVMALALIFVIIGGVVGYLIHIVHISQINKKIDSKQINSVGGENAK